MAGLRAGGGRSFSFRTVGFSVMTGVDFLGWIEMEGLVDCIEMVGLAGREGRRLEILLRSARGRDVGIDERAKLGFEDETDDMVDAIDNRLSFPAGAAGGRGSLAADMYRD